MHSDKGSDRQAASLQRVPQALHVNVGVGGTRDKRLFLVGGRFTLLHDERGATEPTYGALFFQKALPFASHPCGPRILCGSVAGIKRAPAFEGSPARW
jgi:hypothetical protein